MAVFLPWENASGLNLRTTWVHLLSAVPGEDKGRKRENEDEKQDVHFEKVFEQFLMFSSHT